MKSRFIIMSVIALSLGGIACGNKKGDNTEQTTHDTSMQISKKQQVVELLKAIETGASEPVGYINADNYKQHNLTVADGLAGFGEALAALPKGSARVNTVRVFEDGDYVFEHTDYNFFGEKIGFHIFSF